MNHRQAGPSLLVVILVALAPLAAGGCKDDRAAQKGPAPQPAPVAPVVALGAQAPGFTETEVVLGEPAAFSGPSAGLGVEMWRGATAAFAAASEKGVNGRKIVLRTADDAYDADRAAAAVVQLVEREHVFALFGAVGTPTIVRALPVVRMYSEDSGLFYFANFTGAQAQRQPPNLKVVFNVRASYYEETRAMVDAFVKAGKKRIGVFAQDDAYGADGRSGVEKALAAHGATMVAETRYPRGQKYEESMKAQLDVLRGAGADAVIMIAAYQGAAALVRDARTAGWTVPFHAVSFVGADQMLSLLRADENRTGTHLIGNLVVTQVVPHYDDAAIPLVAAYRADIDRYHPTAPPGTVEGSYVASARYSFGSLEGYIDARLFAAILEKAGRDLTRQAFVAAAETKGPFDIGLGVPAEFSPTRHQAFDKVWFTVATPSGWAPTQDPMSVMK